MKIKTIEDLKKLGFVQEYCDLCGKIKPLSDIESVEGEAEKTSIALWFLGTVRCKKCMNTDINMESKKP